MVSKSEAKGNRDAVPAVFDVDGQYPIVVELNRMLYSKQSFELDEFILDGDGITFDFPNHQGHMIRIWVPRDQIGIITQRHDDPVEEEDESDEDDDSDSQE